MNGEKQTLEESIHFVNTHDQLQSKWSKKRNKTQEKIQDETSCKKNSKENKKHCQRYSSPIRKMVMHKFSYCTSFYPSFDTQRMVKRAKRKIGSKTARAMLIWSHYQFKQRLLDKTKEYPWCKIQIVDEDYTSKTCGYCGNIHQKETWK